MLNKQKSIDGFFRKIQENVDVDWPAAKFSRKHKNSSLLFSKYGRTENFSTESLGIHFVKSDKTPDFRSLDGFLRFDKKIPVRSAIRYRKYIYAGILEEYGNLRNYFANIFKGSFHDMSMARMWNVSIVGALIFGMFIMTFIYRYLGQGASAGQIASSQTSVAEMQLSEEAPGTVLGLETKDGDPNQFSGRGEVEDYVAKIMQEYKEEANVNEKMKREMTEMVKGYPIEKMIPFIVKENPVVAAFMVSIAKKESAWGLRVPLLDGEDCYNYWGYRGKRARMGTGGHTCFDSPKDAVETVAKRLSFLVSNEKMTTPGKMVVVWKCGYDCSWDNPEAVRKWVSDVDHYFQKLNKFGG